MNAQLWLSGWLVLGLCAGALPGAPGPAAEGPAADAPDVAAGYVCPTLAIPHASTPPTIDGAVDDAEWQSAFSADALGTVRGQLSLRRTRWWVAWDEKNLYVAMRSPLRNGERLIQRNRLLDGDESVIWDDCYEFWIDVGAKTSGGHECYVQYLGNLAGAVYDNLRLPAIGIRRMGYAAGWAPRNRIVERDGVRVWEMEVAVPFASLQLAKPFAPGQVVKMVLARNYKRPWEQNSLGAFGSTEGFASLVLSKDVPALHLLGVGDPAGDTVGVTLAGHDAKGRDIAWSYADDAGVSESGTAKAGTDAPKVLVDKPALSPAGKGSYRIRATTDDGKGGRTVLLDWCSQRSYGMADKRADVLDAAFEDGGQVALDMAYNPIRDYVRVTGDFIDYDDRARIAKGIATVTDESGKVLATQELTIDDKAYMRGVLRPGELTPGKYLAKLTCLDAAGETVLQREKDFLRRDHAKEFAWWNTKHGRLDTRVPSPWTPVAYKDGVLGVWGREMKVGPEGLPESITTQELPMLRGPVQMEVTLPDAAANLGNPSPIEVKLASDPRVTARAAADRGPVRVESEVTAEFDGMYRVRLTLSPRDGKPVTLKAVRMVVPLAAPFDRYLHASGEGIRWGYDCRSLPTEKLGPVWDSTVVDGQRMTVGSFIPFLWVGCPKGGLAWFADSDQGWVPNDKVPAIEIYRPVRGGQLLLDAEKKGFDWIQGCDIVFNFISSDFELKEPRTIEFAFQATPVKPMHKGWRADPWSIADTFAEYQCAQKVGSDRRASPVPWTFDVDKCRQMVEKQHNSTNGYWFGIDKYPATAVPYSRHNELVPRHMVPEAAYLAEHWNMQNSWHIFYDRSMIDYFIHHYAQWCEQTGIDGIYSDNVRPEPCWNVEAGRGYRLPDGRVQPAYNLFGVREYFLRMRAAFDELGKRDKIVIHMTHNMVIPWIGAADIAYEGEDGGIDPKSPRDHMDTWPIERLMMDIPHQWGVAVKFMPTGLGNGTGWPAELVRARARAWMGHVGLFDIVPDRHIANPQFFAARDRFGIEADDVTFAGFWDVESPVRCEDKDVYVSAWKRPGKVLLLVVNERNAKDAVNAAVRLDPKVLGLPDATDWKVYDAEQLATYTALDADGNAVKVSDAHVKPLGLSPDGTITVPVGRHDYRQIIVEAE